MKDERGKSKNSMDNEPAREIYEKYSRYVFSTALFLTGSRNLADDIAQDSFLRIFRSYDSYDQKKPIKPWIYKIVLNTARTALKRQSKSKTVPLEFDISSDGSDVVDNLVQHEHREALLQALSRLSHNSKEIIVLRFFNNMRLPEIAETLSIPLGTCKSRLNTAMSQLRKELPTDIAARYQGGEEIEES